MITQEDMDQLGAYAAEMHGERMEQLTYRGAGRAPFSVRGYLGAFSRVEQARDPVLRTLRQLRIQTALFPGTPTLKDVAQWVDGTVYDIDRIDGGPGHPWWILTVRQVG
jgi:hypothetical protein